MYLTVEEAVSLLCSLSEAKKMKVAFQRQKWYTIGLSTVGSLLGAMVGGLAGGPPGLVAGGTTGTALGVWITSGKFEPVPKILKDLPPDEKKKLHSHVVVIIRNLEWKDVVQLTKLVMGSKALQEQLLALLEGYVTKELGATVQFDN